MATSNKILLFSDHLFFSKIVELPVAIKQKDIMSFVENELESSSPISIELLKWSYMRSGSNVLIFASTPERLSQAGFTHDEQEQAEALLPEVAMLAKMPFKDGWSIVKMPKAINAIYKEKGVWLNFKTVELGLGDVGEQVASFAKQNNITDFNLYTYEGYSVGALSGISVSLKGENVKNINSSFSPASVFYTLDIREKSILDTIKAKERNARMVLCMFLFVPILAAFIIKMHLDSKDKEQKVLALDAQIAELNPRVKRLQGLRDQIASAEDIFKPHLFNALLLARVDDLRLEGIVFSKTVAKTAYHMEIQGSATSLSLLNEYKGLLEENEYIEKVGLKSSSKSSGAKFTLNITFKGQN